MKHMGIIIGVVVVTFLLATFNANNAMSGESCCGINKGEKESAKAVATDEKSDNDCPVCGKAADSKGKQVDVEHDGKTSHLCCKGCANAYNENPDKYSKSEHSSQSHREEHPRSEHPKKKKERGAGYY